MIFDPATLKGRAVAQSGLEDFGAAPLDDGLAALCSALREEAGLNEAGQRSVEDSIVATLKERLCVERCLFDNPEILEQELLPQIFVVGLPRTGSTALSQFLSEDPDARSVRRWEINSLTPPPDDNIVDDPRLVATRQAFAERDRAMPAFRTMLPVEAEDPSEHGPLLGLTFRNLQLPVLFAVPSYTHWLLHADMTPAYEYLGKVLKLLQWKTDRRHWNLKNPPDLFCLDVIHATFPKATLLWTHRDPAKAIPSVASLASMQREPIVSRLDRPSVIREILTFQAEGVRRGLAARARIGEGHFIDSTQMDLARDTIGVVKQIYDRMGLPFTDLYEVHLRRRIDARPRGQHGTHQIDLADYALTETELRQPFSEYLSIFEHVLG